jgi:threonine dehydratase
MDLATIQAVRKEILPYVKRTPLIRCLPLEQALKSSGRLFLKCENLQWTNSFKARGAFAAMLRLSPEEKKRGVITRSAGNFAQAVARAAHQLKINATIIMPLAVPKVKKEATAQYGVNVILHGKTQQEEQEKVTEIAQKENLVVLSPYDYLDVIAGQGSIALEIYEQLPTIKNFVGQIGGGGLLAGTATAFKGLKSMVQTIGVEPIGAQDYFLSRKAGKRTPLDHTDTIADGLKAPQVGACNWPLLQKYVDQTVVVSDEAIIKAMAFLYNEMGIIVEPSGATGLATLFTPTPLQFQGDTAFVLSGANVDREKFYAWIEK